MSWWKNKSNKRDKGEPPAEIYNKISQPVTEMVRRIKAGECEIHPVYTYCHLDFNAEGNVVSRITVSWGAEDADYDLVLYQDWMTKVEVSAIVSAVKENLANKDVQSKVSEREKWCKLMGVEY